MANSTSHAGTPHYVTVRDGLRLHARRYEAPRSDRAPVLCLAGLTRNSRDFHDLALALSTGPRARTVLALDSRGRGRSDWDRNWRNYSLLVEMLDVLDYAAAAGLHNAHVIGTSRGGLIAMVLAAAQPTLLRTVVLNDIGPVIEAEGLARIAGYVGRMPEPRSWQQAAELAADAGRRAFPAVTLAEWEEVARAWYNEANGKPVPGYDRRIAKTLATGGGAIPQLWPQFAALARIPVLVIRGQNSDILSAATFEQMQVRHPDCAGLIVDRQGHAPFLKDAPTIAAIEAFLSAAEAGERIGGRNFAAAA
jgi:pimeloyl-ACP methyl ester carboxylesterase